MSDRLPPQGLWSHQAEAIDLVRAGRSVAVATGTASGKSLCYQLPVAEAVAAGGTSLLVYPTKALAQDQLQALDRWMPDGSVAATYDGDSTAEERVFVRSNASAILTNPEMLHHGILSNHARWGSFLHDLRIVVIDELHTLRGVFGTHVAQILRRLRRLVLHYGGVEPTFVFTSATVGDPQHLASQLCGRAVRAVTTDASPRGQRSIALWNPASEERSAGSEGRWSVHAEAALLAGRLIRARTCGPWSSAGPAEAPNWSPPTSAGSSTPTTRTASARTGPATCPPNDARSNPSCSRARSRAWSRPAHSSSVSTSAGSTPWCCAGTRAPSRRSGSRPAGRAAPMPRRSRC